MFKLLNDIVYNDKLDSIYKAIQNESLSGDTGLMGGSSGVALFLFYYAKFKEHDEVLEYAQKWIEHSIENISFRQLGLAGGGTGVLWALNHLIDNGFVDHDKSELLNFTDDLYQKACQLIENGKYDYLHEGLGVVLYLLDLDYPKQKSNMENIVNILERCAIQDDEGTRWASIIDSTKSPKNVYNLSMSHGISSIMVILSKIYQKGYSTQMSKNLIHGIVQYITNHKNQDTSISTFPNVIPVNEPYPASSRSRLAWCYGDLGMGIALLLSAININDSELKAESLNVLKHTAKRKNLKESRVVDAELCHGAAGIAHIFHRIYQYTNEQLFADTSKYWFNQTLLMGNFSDGLAGYKINMPEEHGGWQNDSSLLMGIAGIGLTFISALSDIEPGWDECLLLS